MTADTNNISEAGLTVHTSRNGRGVFATKNFAPEEVVYEVVGTLMTCDVDDETRANTYRFDEDRYLSPAGTLGDFFNHSCEPNAKVVKRNGALFVVALEPVSVGQEITFDYSTLIASDDVWELVCNCDSPHCRKVIQSIDSIPDETLQKYQSLGMIPEYILAV